MTGCLWLKNIKRLARNLFYKYGDIKITAEGLQNIGIYSVSTKQRGILLFFNCEIPAGTASFHPIITSINEVMMIMGL